MVKKSTKYFSAILAILGGIALIFILYHFKFFWIFDKQLQDKLFIRQEVSEDIIIIGIDDESIQSFGQWPWNREIHAEMIEKLENSGVKAIGYDVTFSEKGIGDEKFIETLFNSERVVFPMEGSIKLRQGNIPKFTKTLWPINEIKHKFLIGHVVLVPDSDGQVRKAPFHVENNGQLIPPFFMRVLQNAGQWKDPENINPIVYNFNKYGLFKIKFFGPKRTFDYYSFFNVFAEDFKIELLKDKIVLIGAVAPDLHDAYFTPTSQGLAVPGVEIQANLIEAYIQNEFIKQPSDKIDYLLHLAMLGLFTGLCVFSMKCRYSIPLFFILIILYLFFVSAMFSFNYLMPILYPVLLIILIYILGILAKYFLTSKEKQKIKAGFSQYVAKEVVDEIIKNPEKLKLGGERRKLTVLFSDIRKFTSLSEKLSPEDLVELLNDYLSSMGEVVVDNDGIIDKFIGDAIMAFWGAPLENENQEKDAVRSALLMTEKLKVFNQNNISKNRPALNIGIGINTGEVIVGNIGSKKRFDYTAIGDEVNLASRLEGLTKYYGVSVIVSEKVIHKVNDEFVVRYLDNVAVKGKKEGVRIFEVLGVKLTSKKHEQFALEFGRAANIYLNQNFKEAKYVFEKLKQKRPDDKPVQLYLDRINKYLQKPSQDFDGVFKADFK